MLEVPHHYSGFVSIWTTISFRFPFENPFVPKHPLSLKQLHQVISVVLMQEIHLILHGTLPLPFLHICHSFLIALWLTFIMSTTHIVGGLGLSRCENAKGCLRAKQKTGGARRRVKRKKFKRHN